MNRSDCLTCSVIRSIWIKDQRRENGIRTDFRYMSVEEVFVDLSSVSSRSRYTYSTPRGLTILAIFAPMYGRFCTSPRSLAVIFRGKAGYPVSGYVTATRRARGYL